MKYEIVREVYYNRKGKKQKGDYLIRYQKNILGFKWYKFITHTESPNPRLIINVKTTFKSYNSAEKYVRNVLKSGKKIQKTEYILAGEVNESTIK